MSREKQIEIKEGAIFIADSHYPHHGDDFFALLLKIESGELNPSQIFLMGDNFDLLFGHNAYIQTFSKEAIALLQKLSKKREIFYFEGNHDFCLSSIFPDIRVYSREQQPAYFKYGEKRVAMSHGDRFATGFGYGAYTKLLRNRVMLTLLRPFEKKIIDKQMKKLSEKKICNTFSGFEKRAEMILESYGDADMVIEGHFHQSKVLGKYVSLPSLACQGMVGVAEKGEIHFRKI